MSDIEQTRNIELSDDEVFTIQAAVEHLRGGIPDDPENRERRSDAAFRIAYKLEQIANRTLSRSLTEHRETS